jgi:C1A family cysteine protease
MYIPRIAGIDKGDFSFPKRGVVMVNSRRFLLLAPAMLLGIVFGLARADDDEPKGDGEKVYATGRVVPADMEERKVRAAERNAGYHFPRATAATLDWTELGIVPPVVNQGNCGSCWDFAGCGTCSISAIRAGHGKADGSYRLSEQFVLDCSRNGGCNGDDHSTVFDLALKTGLPLAAEYGPYKARAGACGKATHFQKIKGWGYCEPGARGPASVQSIKDAMSSKGPISVAIAADSRFMNVKAGSVFDGRAANINHEVILVGWDDAKGAWKLRNSWGTGWADQGYCWIKYGANNVGVDAAWVDTVAIDPPSPPPLPPGPAPQPWIPQWIIQLLIAILSALAGVYGGKVHSRIRAG